MVVNLNLDYTLIFVIFVVVVINGRIDIVVVVVVNWFLGVGNSGVDDDDFSVVEGQDTITMEVVQKWGEIVL